jgi:cell division septum initiation protein DivIVA
LQNIDSSKRDSISRSIKHLEQSIKSIREDINGKPQEKQGYGTIPQVTVNSNIANARSTALYKNAVPGEQEEKLYKVAEESVQKVAKKAGNFFDTEWNNFRNYVESAKLDLFKKDNEKD